MTDGSNGAPQGAGGSGQEEDPFAYLYRPADGETAAERSPRNSYARPMEVGRAQYGQQQPPQYQEPQYQQPAPRPQGAGSGGEQTTQLPHQSRYAERSRPAPGEDAPRGRGKGPVVAVVAVVAAIAIGSGIALSGNDGKSSNSGAAATPSTGHSAAAGASPSLSPSAPASGSSSAAGSSNSVVDASKAQAQGAQAGNSVKGAISSDGSYLALQPGSSVTWTITVPAAGKYKFWVHFNNNGDDAKAAVSVNGADRAGGVPFKNYGAKGGDQRQSWFSTNIWPDLQAGANTITVSAPTGAGVLIDQVGITGMDSNSYPSGAAAPTS